MQAAKSTTDRPSTPMYDLRGKRVFVAGHKGMVGSAILRRLRSIEAVPITAGRGDLDLRSQKSVRDYFERERPQAVFLAAARVGGIRANDEFPADFLYDNLMIEANVIESAHACSVEKLLFLGSSCIYPRMAAQPMNEDALLTGPLEETNQWYAVAKIAGIKLCQAYRRQHGDDFISAMPTNLYGPGDNFNLDKSHVLPALIMKADKAKREGARTMEIWGTGRPLREFLHVDDAADACIFLMQNYSAEGHVNVGSGEEISIRDLASLIASAVGADLEITTKSDAPDGTPRKLMDSSKLRSMGWSPSISLADGIADTYRWFKGAQSTAVIRT